MQRYTNLLDCRSVVLLSGIFVPVGCLLIENERPAINQLPCRIDFILEQVYNSTDILRIIDVKYKLILIGAT